LKEGREVEKRGGKKEGRNLVSGDGLGVVDDAGVGPPHVPFVPLLQEQNFGNAVHRQEVHT
jgi:hypothetical protein